MRIALKGDAWLGISHYIVSQQSCRCAHRIHFEIVPAELASTDFVDASGLAGKKLCGRAPGTPGDVWEKIVSIRERSDGLN